MKRTIAIFLFFFSFCFVSFGQNKNIDSLIVFLKTAKKDTTKLIALNTITREFAMVGEVDTAMFFAKQAIKISDTLLKESHSEGVERSIQKHRANSFNSMGNLFNAHSNYPEALKYYLMCLKIKEKLVDKKGIATAYNNIGLIYYGQQNYEEAKKNYFEALKVRTEIGDVQGMSACYSNLGLIYYNQNQYKEALEYHFKALKIRAEGSDRYGIANSYNNIGNVYYDQGNYKEALENLLASVKIKEELNDKMGLASSYTSIGNVLAKQKEFKRSEEYLLKSQRLAKEIGYLDVVKYSYKGLSELDSSRGNFKGAFENHVKYIQYRDSLNNEQTRKKTIQNQMTFDFEKKEAVTEAEHKMELENQQALAEEKSHKQKMILLFVVCSLCLVLVFAGFVFRSLRVTRKQKDIIEVQKKLVETQKAEVEQQKALVEEHQKEIIDSITYARRIQRSLLPTEKYIERSLNRLMTEK